MKLNIDKVLFQWSHRISSSELHIIESGSPCFMRNKQNHAKKKQQQQQQLVIDDLIWIYRHS